MSDFDDELTPPRPTPEGAPQEVSLRVEGIIAAAVGEYRVRGYIIAFPEGFLGDVAARIALAAIEGSRVAPAGGAARHCGSCGGELQQRQQWVCVACNLIAQEGTDGSR